MRIRKSYYKVIFKYLLVLVALIIFLVPILRLIARSFRGDGTYGLQIYGEILRAERTWKVIKNTMIMVLGSSIIASILGLIFSWLIAYTDIRYKKLFQLGVYLPFIIPSYVSSLAWVQFFGKNGQLQGFVSRFIEGFKGYNLYSMGGIILVMGLTTYPLVYLFTLNSLRQIPRECELAARISGASNWQTFRKITLPMALPGLVGGIFIAFLNSLDNFGIPAFLGSSANITVLTTYIYQQVTGFGVTAFSKASVLSVILGIISLLGLAIQWLFLARNQRLESQINDYEVRFYFGKKKVIVEVLIVIFFLITSILPLVSLIVSPLYKVMGRPLTKANLTLENYKYILTSPSTKNAILVSFRLALVTGLLCLIVGTLFAYYRVRTKDKLSKVIESIITLPYALPGTVFALSMIFAWMQPIPGWNPGIYGSIAILYIAYFTRFLSLQVRTSVASFMQLDTSIEEASRISGSNGIVKWRKILIPLIFPSAIGGTFLVFLMSLTELTLSSLLYSSKSQTIGVSILSFQQSGYLKYATAFSSLIVIIILITYLILSFIQRLGKR